MTGRAALRAEDGVRIDAHHDSGPPDLAIVVAHGFTGSWRRPAMRRTVTVLGRHAGVVTFDFRGHGGSGGASTVGDQEILDLAAAVDWAHKLGYRAVATLGFSMGAAVAVRHAAQHGTVAAVAAVSGPSRWYYRGTPPMRRVHWVIERPVGRLVCRLALRTRIATGGWDPPPAPPHAVADRISPAPLLVVHGDADTYFPLEHAHALYAAAGEPKELWVEPGLGHAGSAAPPALLERIGTWLTRAVVPAGGTGNQRELRP
ncbi:MAG TPA: alpha/beta fold hydrolase [Micromonospora sp.]|nr:alpha/beta fold hydrolase [Micromonospora sp.]